MDGENNASLQEQPAEQMEATGGVDQNGNPVDPAQMPMGEGEAALAREEAYLQQQATTLAEVKRRRKE